MNTATHGAILEDLAGKFVGASERRGARTFARVPFPERLDGDRPVMPEQFVTLHEHPACAALDDAARWRLGLLETVNFFSLNIHGEQALVAEFAERLYRARWPWDAPNVSRYLQHFIHEENSHPYMLAEFCTRYYGRVMPEIVYRFENPALSATGRDLLLFCRLYVLETLLDFVNRTAMCDEQIDITARRVHRSHHLDESVHIAFDRAIVGQLTLRLRHDGLADEVRTVEALTRKYAVYAFARLVNPRVYRELGLADSLRIAREVQGSARWCRLQAQWREPLERFFKKSGVFAQEPVTAGRAATAVGGAASATGEACT